jgi:hypothetical protein
MRVSHESVYRDVYVPSRKAFDASMFHRLSAIEGSLIDSHEVGTRLRVCGGAASKPNGSPSWCRPKTTACSTAAYLEVCWCTVRRVQAPRNELPMADHAPLRLSG